MGDGSGWVTEDEMIEVDRVMVDDLGIALVQMMENAGRNLAQFTIERHAPARVVVGAGSGGNGGGGLAAARHLANRGVSVMVALTRSPGDLSGIVLRQWSVLERMGIELIERPADAAPDVVIDALIGYSLRGAPEGSSRVLIEAMNAGDAPIVALDVPSGIDATTGVAPGVSVCADATLTLAAPKTGLRTGRGVGELFVADISVPPLVFAALGHRAPNFSESTVVAVTG
jgi:NAD(P)H-hydrate epimerase